MDPLGPVPGLIHTWSPELTLEVATEQVNGREGDGERGSKWGRWVCAEQPV